MRLTGQAAGTHVMLAADLRNRDYSIVKLYGYYRSSASYRIRIVLNAKSIDWANVPVRLDKGEQLEPAHSERNPMKLVPVLDTGEHLLAQSVAIAEYLESRFPEPPLLPHDEAEKAMVREMVQIVASDIQPIGNLRVLKHLRKNFGLDDAGVDEWCRTWIGRGFQAFEQRAVQRSDSGRYSFGDTLTFADAWLMPQVYNAERFGLDLAPFPTIRSIAEHCATIDAVAAAHPARQPDAPGK